MLEWLKYARSFCKSKYLALLSICLARSRKEVRQILIHKSHAELRFPPLNRLRNQIIACLYLLKLNQKKKKI